MLEVAEGQRFQASKDMRIEEKTSNDDRLTSQRQ
jgi:hypothetical protein